MTETGLNTMMGEAAKSIQESGGKHVGVFEAKIIMAHTMPTAQCVHSALNATDRYALCVCCRRRSSWPAVSSSYLP